MPTPIQIGPAPKFGTGFLPTDKGLGSARLLYPGQRAAETTDVSGTSLDTGPTAGMVLPNTSSNVLAKARENYNKLIELQIKNAEAQQKQMKQMGTVAALQSGLQTGSSVQPTTSTGGAMLQTVGAGLSGAASGAMMGSITGPGALVGGVIGGITGIVSGGLQSYLGLQEYRQNARDMDKWNREAKRANEQARQDMLKQVAWNQKFSTAQEAFSQQYQSALLGEQQKHSAHVRRQDLLANRERAIAQRWGVLSDVRNRMTELISSNEKLKDLFIQRSR